MEVINLIFLFKVLVVNLESRVPHIEIEYYLEEQKSHYIPPAQIPVLSGTAIRGKGSRLLLFMFFKQSIGKPSGKKWFPKRWIFKPPLEPFLR